jgi:protein disulfide-isomerase
VESNKENKPLLLFFWGAIGGWCIKLQNEVLKTADFKNGCRKRSFGRVDFPRKIFKRQRCKIRIMKYYKLFGCKVFRPFI